MASRNINDIVTFVQYIIRKERGIFLLPSQCTANLDNAQMECFEEWFKLYGINQEVHDSLRPFRVYYQFTSNASGFVTYPSDYQHILGTAFTVSGSTVNEITFPNEDEFVSALNSQLRPVSLSEPIARDTSTGFSLYPQSTQIGFFTYLRRPATPVFAYTQVGRAITYDAANSVQLEWSDSFINRIIATSLKFVGINFDDNAILKFAESYEKENE